MTSIKDALKGAGVTRNSVPHAERPPRNKKEWLQKYGLEEKPSSTHSTNRPVEHKPTGEKYIVLPFAKLHDGSIFVPIERMGKTFYYNKLVEEFNGEEVSYFTLHLAERRWQITKDLFIKDSNARSMSLTTGKDAIFALNDWAIVKVK